MKKIENPSKYEVKRITEWGLVSAVYVGGLTDLAPAELHWRENDGEEVLTLKEIAGQLEATIITVFIQEPMGGVILQWGNYGDEWWQIGETCGYA